MGIERGVIIPNLVQSAVNTSSISDREKKCIQDYFHEMGVFSLLAEESLRSRSKEIEITFLYNNGLHRASHDIYMSLLIEEIRRRPN